jgi:hypothetical protein
VAAVVGASQVAGRTDQLDDLLKQFLEHGGGGEPPTPLDWNGPLLNPD